MLSWAMTDSYLESKLQTQDVTDWLHLEAEKAGRPSAAKSVRLKGKDRKALREAQKEAQKEAQAAFTVKELIEQAKQISHAQPRVEVPEYVGRSLRRTINKRKRFTAWYSTRPDRDVEADRKHKHFTTALEAVGGLLSIPLILRRSTSTNTSNLQTGGSPNFFTGLEVEEDYPDEDQESNVAPNRANRPSAATFESVAATAAEEKHFKAFCFFEDIHRFQDFVSSKLQEYANGRRSTEAVSIVVGAAIELVKERETRLFDLMQEEPTYFRVIADLYGKSCSDLTEIKEQVISRGPRAYSFSYHTTAATLQRIRDLTLLYRNYPLPIKPEQERSNGFSEGIDWVKEDKFLVQYFIDLPIECVSTNIKL
jgi:hypothetical protein